MSSSEFIEWMAFSRLEPFGSEVEDYRAGIGPAVALHINRAEAGKPMMNPLDLLPWTEQPVAPMPDTPQQLEAKMRQFAAKQDAMRKHSHG